jgi:hypothetical protein
MAQQPHRRTHAMGLAPHRSAESRMTICGLQTTLTRYARAAALAVLAVEEVGKFKLLKGDKTEAQQAMRYHPPKQRAVASFITAEAAFDGYERTLHSMGLDWIAIHDVPIVLGIVGVTPAGQKWIDSQGGSKVPERLKSDTSILENMAEAFRTVAQSRLVRETLAGTLSRWKERGFYVDVSSTQELLSDPKEVTKEQAEECLAYAQIAVAKVLR